MDSEIFTSLEFKKLVDDSETRGEGLLKFARASEKFDADKKDNHDIVKSYISSSGDCAELLLCLKGEISPTDLSTAFRCLINILSRTASDLQEFYGKVGLSICDAILRYHLQKVYHALGLHQSPRPVSNALKMLTLLVMQGKEAARDVSFQLDFNLRCFKDVLKRFKGKFAFEIRKAYIRFVVSFFMSGDVRTINKIFDTRGFVSLVFPGLIKDTASTIQMVLTAILENGVKNTSVSKSSRVRFFAESKLLRNISSLFEWDGIFDISGSNTSLGKDIIHQMVYNFLYHVCCPFEYGINFLDKELGFGEKCKNHVLLDFILHLTSSTTHRLIRDLVVNILKACPDLLPRFMKDFRMTLEPNSEDIWKRNCELVKYVYESQPDVATGLLQMVRLGKNRSKGPPRLDTLVKTILPGVISPNFSCLPVLKHCMKSKSLEIRCKSLQLLLHFMHKLEASIPFMLNKSNWEKAGFSSEEAEICYAKFEDALFENHVNISFLVQLWKDISPSNDTSLKTLLLKIITSCQKLFPADVQETKYDFTRLLKSVQTNIQDDDTVDHELDIMIMEMLSEGPEMYKWFKIFDKKNTAFKMLLQVIQNSPKCGDLHNKSVKLCQKVLVAHGIFQQSEVLEAAVWISNIVGVLKTHNDCVMAQYFAEICSKVIRMPMKYFDILSVKNEELSMASTDSFWELLPNVDIETVCNDDWMTITAQKATCDVFEDNSHANNGTMSLLAIAGLDALKEISLQSEEKKILDQYLVRVYSQLLNLTQNTVDGEYFAHVFGKCASTNEQLGTEYPLLNKFLIFSSIWTKKEVKSRYLPPDSSITSQMQMWFWEIMKDKKPQKNLSATMSLLHENDSSSLMFLLSQCLLYFDTLFVTSNLKSLKSLFFSILELFQEVTKRSESTGTADMIQSQLWILQNPAIQSLFFQNISQEQIPTVSLTDHGLMDITDVDSSLDSVCTYAISKLLIRKKLSDVNPVDRIYVSKVVRSLPGLLQYLTAHDIPCDFKCLLLPEVYNEIKDILSYRECKDIIFSVAEILPMIVSKKVAKLASQFLSVAIQRLCSHDSIDLSGFHTNAKYIFDFLGSNVMGKPSSLIPGLTLLIRKFPSLAVNSDDCLLQLLLKHVDRSIVELCVLLIRSNPSLMESLVKSDFISKLSSDDKIVTVPLANFVLISLLKDASCYGKEIRTIFDAYWPLLTLPISWEELSLLLKSNDGESLVKILMTLGSDFGKEEDVVNFLNALTETDQFFLEVTEILVVLCSISSTLIRPKVGFQIKISCLLLIQKMTINTSVNPEITFDLCNRILDSILPSDLKSVSAKLCLEWPKFVKQTLKRYFDCCSAIRCITSFVHLLYCENEPGIDIETLRGMVTSHSKFLESIILEEDTVQEVLKCAILDLHYQLVGRSKASDLSPSDFCYLLSAYTATLSKSDQIILKTLLAYERKEVSLSDMKPFLWGKGAISSYRARKNVGENLWKKPGSGEVLSCISDSVMDVTIKHFPLRRRMVLIKDGSSSLYFENDSTGTISALKNQIVKESVSCQTVYDPCFLLPSFLHILSLENLVDCKAFVRSGALSFLMCCLASHCHVVRALAANCLCLYYDHARTAWFPENNLAMYLIRCVRNSMPTKDDKKGNKIVGKLSSVVANFLGTVVQLILKPKDHMFSVLHRYLLIKPQLDLKDIPEFFVLFFSAEMESKLERTWVVNLVCNGLRDHGDYNTINRRNMVQLLMCLHDSAVGDNFVRRQVFEVFERICLIRTSAFDLVKNRGFVSWLAIAASNQPQQENKYSKVAQTIGRPGQRRDDTKDIIRVLSTLWKSLDASDLVEKMEIDGDQADGTMENNGKRISVAPFNILKQIVSLSVMLQENLLKSQDFDVEFCKEGLHVLLSCIVDLMKRNEETKHKSASINKYDNECFLSDKDIEVLFSAAKKLIKAVPSQASSQEMNSICTIVKIFMSWVPESNQDSPQLWNSVFYFVSTTTSSIWSKNCDWVKFNCLSLCTWLKRGWTKIDFQLKLSDRMAIVMLYDAILKHSNILGPEYFESLKILNGILRSEKIDDEESGFQVLKNANEIRRQILLEG